MARDILTIFPSAARCAKVGPMKLTVRDLQRIECAVTVPALRTAAETLHDFLSENRPEPGPPSAAAESLPPGTILIGTPADHPVLASG